MIYEWGSWTFFLVYKYFCTNIIHYPRKVDLFLTRGKNLHTTQWLKFKINHHTSNISNPAISNTPMKKAFFDRVVKVWLHLFTNHLKSLSYVALHRAPIEKKTWSLVRPCVTNSLPTLILGLSKLWYSSSKSMSKSLATISPAYFEKEKFTLNEKWYLWSHSKMFFGILWCFKRVYL